MTPHCSASTDGTAIAAGVSRFIWSPNWLAMTLRHLSQAEYDRVTAWLAEHTDDPNSGRSQPTGRSNHRRRLTCSSPSWKRNRSLASLAPNGMAFASAANMSGPR
jgi:hypothetical protein